MTVQIQLYRFHIKQYANKSGLYISRNSPFYRKLITNTMRRYNYATFVLYTCTQTKPPRTWRRVVTKSSAHRAKQNYITRLV